MSYRGIRPRILWGASLDKAIDFAYPLDDVVSWSDPAQGSAFAKCDSGEEDSWVAADDYFLEGDMRRIPIADQLSPRASGWEGTKGVEAFLQSGRRKNQFRFYPDARNLIKNGDFQGGVALASDWVANYGSASSGLLFASTAGLQQQQYHITLSALSGAGGFGGFSQVVNGIMPSEVLTLSGGAFFGAGGAPFEPLPTGAVILRLWMYPLDSTGAVIGAFVSNSTTSVAAVASLAVTGTMPAGTASVVVAAYAECVSNAPQEFDAYFRSLMLARAATAQTFVTNPYWLAYLEEPMSGAPALERNTYRKLRMRMRSAAGLAFTGF